jgi:hypothetical protein
MHSTADCASREPTLKPAPILVLLFVAAPIALVAWHFRTTTVAYRLTLELNLDGETYLGSGVIAGAFARNANPLAPAEWAATDRGEAIAMDLGRHGLLFVVLNGRYFAWELPMMVYRGHAPFDDIDGFVHWASHPQPSREVPHQDLPLFVRFRDIAQPKTAECVDPDHMEASFPPGASATLVSATIEIVDEPVTTGQIEKRLPWLMLDVHEMYRLLTGPYWFRWRPRTGECGLLPGFFEAGK